MMPSGNQRRAPYTTLPMPGISTSTSKNREAKNRCRAKRSQLAIGIWVATAAKATDMSSETRWRCDQMTDYRIVKAIVEYCNGHTSHYAIGYMAERRLRLFGLPILWWPCINARWRRTAYDAQLDVRNDAELRKEMANGNSRRID